MVGEPMGSSDAVSPFWGSPYSLRFVLAAKMTVSVESIHRGILFHLAWMRSMSLADSASSCLMVRRIVSNDSGMQMAVGHAWGGVDSRRVWMSSMDFWMVSMYRTIERAEWSMRNDGVTNHAWPPQNTASLRRMMVTAALERDETQMTRGSVAFAMRRAGTPQSCIQTSMFCSVQGRTNASWTTRSFT